MHTYMYEDQVAYANYVRILLCTIVNNSFIGPSRRAGRADGIEPVGPPAGHVQPCMTEIMAAGPIAGVREPPLAQGSPLL